MACHKRCFSSVCFLDPWGVCVCVCVRERERERESLLLLKSFVEAAWNLQFLFLKGNARILEYLMLDWRNNV